MQRRDFLSGCGAAVGLAGLGGLGEALASATPRLYERSLLVDVHGEPFKATLLPPNVNYIFQYPYAATPCFLLNLGRAATAAPSLRRADGEVYRWDGGTGPSR